jgi:predicted O-methyltransferase YrrM
MDNAYFNFPNFYKYIASRQDFKRFVEVGVYTGASVCFLAEELAKRPTPFELYAVDLWEHADKLGYTDLKVDVDTWNTFEERMRITGTKEFIKPLKVDSISASLMFEDRSLDFVFIDADHSYGAVKGDIAAWARKVRDGGILAGHDYTEPCGVKQAVDESFGKPNLEGSVWWIVSRGT